MKGLELPINMIVVIAIAVLVLVVVAAFFAGRIGPATNDINLEGAFGSGCTTFRSLYNCDLTQIGTVKVRNYAPPGEPVLPDGWPFGDATNSICDRKGYSNRDCARACGCQLGP